MNNTFVSIITVTYNAEKYIEQTMQNVFAQTYSNIEYLIIDGGSTDGTLEIIEKYKPRLAYSVSEKDNGIYDAMNKGIVMAKGKLIGIINASDFYEPDAVETIVKAFLANPKAGIFHGNANVLNSDGSFFKTKCPNLNLTELHKRFSLQHPTFFVLPEVYQKYGKFDTSFRIAADYDFSLRCHLAGVEFCYINKVITNFRQGGVSQNKLKNIAEGRRVLQKNSYSDEEIVPIIKQWRKAAILESIYSPVYLLAKKIIPLSILNKIAKMVSINK